MLSIGRNMNKESQEPVSGNSDTSIRQDQNIENLEFGEVSVGSIGILLKQPLLIAEQADNMSNKIECVIDCIRVRLHSISLIKYVR